ncbi:MAG: hypothetical protein JO148_00350 [Acidimicrobiia bacterium]|nr:hypothetical protein [Acidimicrobiia bacterium]
MTLPLLGLLTSPEPTPARVSSLLRRLTTWSVLRAGDPEAQVAAWFATSPDALGLAGVLGGDVPVAVWARDQHAAGLLGSVDGVIVVGDKPDVVGPFGGRGVLWPDGVDAERCRPVTPFVRTRWRRRWGLPDSFIWVPDDLAEPPSAEVNRTAFALASAVAAAGSLVVEALAWGAPVATDAATADVIGASDGEEVLVAERAAFRRAAGTLADDQRLAASLGRAGRRLVERRHDIARPAGVIARLLGLRREPHDPAGRVSACLDELWTPAGADIRLRAEGHALARVGR